MFTAETFFRSALAAWNTTVYGATDPCAIWVALVEDPGQIQSPCAMHGLLELITFSIGRFKREEKSKRLTFPRLPKDWVFWDLRKGENTLYSPYCMSIPCDCSCSDSFKNQIWLHVFRALMPMVVSDSAVSRHIRRASLSFLSSHLFLFFRSLLYDQLDCFRIFVSISCPLARVPYWKKTGSFGLLQHTKREQPREAGIAPCPNQRQNWATQQPSWHDRPQSKTWRPRLVYISRGGGGYTL